MAGSLKTGFCISGSTENGLKTKRMVGFCSSVGSQMIHLEKEFKGIQVVVTDQSGFGDWTLKGPANFCVHAQASLCVSRTLRWWDRTLQSNMVEINSAQELVDTLINAGDKLVIIDFYSPGCGGCKALHPKICQFAELNSNAVFLKVNYEQLKTMCYSLNVHVLPFFRFYRGSEGRLCSFSCTNATIKKFKDALAKHGNERCSLGPAKGLEESELLKLASNGEISLDFLSRSRMEDLVSLNTNSNNSLSFKDNKIEVVKEHTALVI